MCEPLDESADHGRAMELENMEGLDESVCKSNAKKKNREDDGELEDFLFGSALGAEDVSASAKGRAQTRPLCLQEDGRDEQERKNDLSDVQDEFEIHNMRLLQRVVDYQDHHKMSTVCYTFPCMDVSMNEDEIHRKRNWVATVATFLVLGLLSVFLWRVLFFTGLIRSGGIDLSNFSFLSSYSASAALASAPLKDGTFDVATTDDPSLGTPGAPVTIVEFADFQCPFSKQESSVLRELAARYPNRSILFIATSLSPIFIRWHRPLPRREHAPTRRESFGNTMTGSIKTSRLSHKRLLWSSPES